MHIITALNYGGAEAMLAKLVQHHAAHPSIRDISVLSLLPLGRVGRQMQADGVPIQSLNISNLWHVPQAAARLAGIVRSHAPDLIQGWMYHGNLAATMAMKVAPNRPSLLWNIRHSLENIALEKASSRFVIRMGALYSAVPRATIYNSAVAVRQHRLQGYSEGGAIVIPNGFDHDRFHPATCNMALRNRLHQRFGIDTAPLLVAVVARRHPMKDHATIIEAVGRARQMGHDVHLLLAGNGTDSLPQWLQEICAHWLPDDRLTLLGDRRDVAEWLPGCDVVALPSAWGEGFPNILGEAMACGIPCLTTDVGDSRMVVGDGGLCVPSSSPIAMAEAIATLSSAGPALRREMGQRGRARVCKEFSLPFIAKRYVQLYEMAMSAQMPPPKKPGTPQCAG